VYFILYHNGLHVCKFFIKNIVLIVQMIILMYTDSGILCIIYKMKGNKFYVYRTKLERL
jgi:hypothetical protein